MNKILALAAIAGSLVTFSAPLTTVTAAELPGKCLVLPALQKDCRAVLRQAAADFRGGQVTPLGRWTNLRESVAIHPVWWECEPTHGGKTVFTCSTSN